jgi:hypothetical protein
MQVSLSPLPETVSIVYCPEISRTMAMRLGGEDSSERGDATQIRAVSRGSGTRQADGAASRHRSCQRDTLRPSCNGSCGWHHRGDIASHRSTVRSGQAIVYESENLGVAGDCKALHRSVLSHYKSISYILYLWRRQLQ